MPERLGRYTGTPTRFNLSEKNEREGALRLASQHNNLGVKDSHYLFGKSKKVHLDRYAKRWEPVAPIGVRVGKDGRDHEE